MQRTAIFSKDKQYRYQLSRRWDSAKPMVLFVMHNPSTADAYKEDPTLIRIINYAKDWGYGGLYVGNLFPYCSSKPKKDMVLPKVIVTRNHRHIKTMYKQSEQTIFAWGNQQETPQWFKKNINYPYCIALSLNNIPKHPLYLKKNRLPKPFNGINH